MPEIATLTRYPVKGFSPESVAQAVLERGGFFPGDRLYAVENGPSGWRAEAPEHFAKIKYLQLMRNEGLAALSARFDPSTQTFTLSEDGAILAQGRLDTEAGRAAIEALLSERFAGELRGPPRILHTPAWRFTDSRKGFVSLMGRGTIAEIERVAGRTVDPLRFRMNVLVDGLAPFTEFDLVGRRFRLGAAVLEGLARTDRCAATEVNPQTARRDIAMVRLLEGAFGHHDAGIYASVVSSGPVAVGDTLSDLGPADTAPERLPF